MLISPNYLILYFGMERLYRNLYHLSWGFSIFWLGLSIILSYYTGYNVIGLFLLGLGLYGVVISLLLLLYLGNKSYILSFSASLIVSILGVSVSLNIFEWIPLLGILLIISGVSVLAYYLM